MWTLVLVVLQFNTVQAKIVDDYNSMTECFEAREQMLEVYRQGDYLQRLPADIQALCMKRTETETLG